MRNKKNRTDILIDVTSLLDVVFIILLIVITQISGSQTGLEAREAKAEEAMREAKTQQEIYRDQLDSQGKVNDYIEFISVVSTYDPDTLTDRDITMHFSAEDEEETFTLKGEAVDEVYEEFTDSLTGYIGGHPDKVIVLSLNEGDEDILYRDEKRIQDIFTDLSSSDPNVRIKPATETANDSGHTHHHRSTAYTGCRTGHHHPALRASAQEFPDRNKQKRRLYSLPQPCSPQDAEEGEERLYKGSLRSVCLRRGTAFYGIIYAVRSEGSQTALFFAD